MKHTIVTISREFGSGGCEIGKKLAEKLGVSFYDKNILPTVAAKHGIPLSKLEAMDEKLSSPVNSWRIAGDADSTSDSDKAFGAQVKVVREIAESESCVFVGRCASDIILDEDVIRIFVYAPNMFKYERIKLRHDLRNLQEAERVVKNRNRDRKRYVEHYTTHRWGAPDSYDLLVDSSKLGIDGTAALLADYVRARVNQNFT